MKTKKIWIDVKHPSQLRFGDRVRFSDRRSDLYAGYAIGDCGEEDDFRYLNAGGRITRKDEPDINGYDPAGLLEVWKFVQVQREVEDERDLAFDVLCAVHEVLHDVPEYSAFVTLKDGRQVQVRGMVLAAIEELDKWQKGSVE